MPYISCPDCGHHALSIATRCPNCGQSFPSRLWQSPASVPLRRRIPRVVIVVGGGLIIAALTQQREPRHLGTNFAPPLAASAIESAPRSLPIAEPVAQVDSAPAGPSVDSVAVSPRPAALPAPAPVPVPTPASDESQERRYASTWVNVRGGRNGSAPVVQVLKPGEAVGVDSLRQGWYRVVADGRPLGYVDRSLVAREPSLTQR